MERNGLGTNICTDDTGDFWVLGGVGSGGIAAVLDMIFCGDGVRLWSVVTVWELSSITSNKRKKMSCITFE